MANDTTEPPWDAGDPIVPIVYVSCTRTGDRVEMRGIHRATWPTRPPGPWHPVTPYSGLFTALLRDAAGRPLSWKTLHMGLVHYYGMPGTDAPRSWAEPSGLYHAELQDHPDATELAIVEGDRVIWALPRPARAPRLWDVRAAVVAAGDLDHPYAAHYVPEAGMLHVTWQDDCESAHYERTVHWATPEQPDGAWTGEPLVGARRGGGGACRLPVWRRWGARAAQRRLSRRGLRPGGRAGARERGRHASASGTPRPARPRPETGVNGRFAELYPPTSGPGGPVARRGRLRAETERVGDGQRCRRAAPCHGPAPACVRRQRAIPRPPAVDGGLPKAACLSPQRRNTVRG